jgi:hypothetical protein
MFGLFAGFFIALFVVVGVAAVVGHVLLVEALVRPRGPQAQQPQATRPPRAPELTHWRRAA